MEDGGAGALGAGVAAEVDIHIEKKLPVQGRFGGWVGECCGGAGGLELELGISRSHPWRDEAAPRVGHPHSISLGESFSSGADFSDADWEVERLRLAGLVGSDVPLFLIGGTVLGLDRGQSVTPLPDAMHETEAVWCVVAIPSVGVSTPQAFRDWDALCVRDGLTAEASEDKLSELSRAYACSFTGAEVWNGSSGVFPDPNGNSRKDLAGPQVSALVRTGIANDFERVVFLQHPLLSEIKRTLAASGTPEAALYASLSGSGSALFGLYRGQGDAEAACTRLQAMGVESLLTRTLTRAEYWRQMLVE